jgi:hypothetical protein
MVVAAAHIPRASTRWVTPMWLDPPADPLSFINYTYVDAHQQPGRACEPGVSGSWQSGQVTPCGVIRALVDPDLVRLLAYSEWNRSQRIHFPRPTLDLAPDEDRHLVSFILQVAACACESYVCARLIRLSAVILSRLLRRYVIDVMLVMLAFGGRSAGEDGIHDAFKRLACFTPSGQFRSKLSSLHLPNLDAYALEHGQYAVCIAADAVGCSHSAWGPDQ